MNVIDQLEFVHYLPLRDLKAHSKGFNFKHDCPDGPDRKRRGYILYGKNDQVTVYCFHCGLSTNLKRFIELYSPTLFAEYCQKEKQAFFTDGFHTKKQTPAKASEVDIINDLKLFHFSKYFIPVSEHREALEYLQKRKVPEDKIETIKWCTHPTKPFGNKIVFPFVKEKYNYGFQCRSLNKKMFYIFSPNDSFKVSGIFSVDTTKDVFVFESIIDSYHKQNSIASLGTSLSENVKKLLPNRVWCYDNDKPAYKKLLLLAEENERMFIWPSEIKAKDCNQLAQDGWSNSMIEGMINNNIYKGLGAKTVLKMRLRRKY